jgi:hypothetical protein
VSRPHPTVLLRLAYVVNASIETAPARSSQIAMLPDECPEDGAGPERASCSSPDKPVVAVAPDAPPRPRKAAAEHGTVVVVVVVVDAFAVLPFFAAACFATSRLLAAHAAAAAAASRARLALAFEPPGPPGPLPPPAFGPP